jgi:hypothetical protein
MGIDKRQLLLLTIQDLNQKLASNNAYDLLRSSGLLRQLLLDPDRLAIKVNQKYKIKLEFEITSFSPPPPDSSLLFWSIHDGLDPKTSRPGSPPIRANLERFLGTVVVRASGTDYTIRQLVIYVAHVMGGVHAGSPTADQEALSRIGTLYVGGLPAGLGLMRAILKVVLKGLEPLVEAIKKDLGSIVG